MSDTLISPTKNEIALMISSMFIQIVVVYLIAKYKPIELLIYIIAIHFFHMTLRKSVHRKYEKTIEAFKETSTEAMKVLTDQNAMIKKLQSELKQKAKEV